MMPLPLFNIGDQVTDRPNSLNATDSFIIHSMKWLDKQQCYICYPQPDTQDHFNFPNGVFEVNLTLEVSFNETMD